MSAHPPSRVVVVGAGALGLSAAYLLRRTGCNVTLVEASPAPGGLLATFDAGGGARLEYFYHHFFTHDTELNWLLRVLDLEGRATFRKTTMGIYRQGRIYPFNGLGDLLRFRAVGLAARLRFGLSSALLAYRSSYANMEDWPALAWFERWAGREATNAVWRPLLLSKFGDAAERVPLAWMAGRLRQRARSRRGGEEQLGYLGGSFQVLVDRWVGWLRDQGAEVRLGEPVRCLVAEDGRVVGVETSAGTFRGDAVLATVPTPVLAQLVRPLDPHFAGCLEEIRYLGAVCLILAMKAPLSTTYWLNVAEEGFEFGAVVEHTNFVGPEHYGGRHIAYFSRYLDLTHPLWSLPDAELTERFLSQAEQLYGRCLRPDVLQSWVFRGRYAAPRTELGFHRLIPKTQSPIPGLYVASMCHVYPDERSINNSIRVAAEALRAVGLARAADLVPHNLSLAGKYGQ